MRQYKARLPGFPVPAFRIVSTPAPSHYPQYHGLLLRRPIVGWRSAPSEKLGDGKRIHINGLGYFSVSIGSTESENPKKMTRGTVQITGVNFQPEKSFKKSIISRAHFVRERYKVHTVDLSPIEVDGLLSEYFKDHRSITCARMQQVCGMTRSTAYRRLQALTQGAHPSLQREGYKNATAYIPVKGHYGRSYTADRW